MAHDPEENRREDDEESEEELDETDYKQQKDAVLFAIDVSSSMMRPLSSSKDKKADAATPLAAAFKCACQIMQQRIISQPKDMMGILLFGTEKSKFQDAVDGQGGSNPYPHCYLFTDLDVPEAKDVKALRVLAEEERDEGGILVPSAEPVSMSNLIFCATHVFTTKAPNFGSRRLFIITDNDDPHRGDKNARDSAAVRAKDLYDLGVVIELFPISHGDRGFDLSKFYDDIIYRDAVEEVENAGSPKTYLEGPRTSRSGDGLTLLKSLISNISSKQTPKRAYFSSKVHFEIAPGLVISIKGYIPLHKQTPARSCFIYLDGEKALLAQAETTKIDAATRTVEKAEMQKAYKFGDGFVHFNAEELKRLKDFGSPCLRIIGFKPRSLLPMWASVKKSVFIYPTEEGFVGSTRVFSALWQKLLKDEKMGLAWFVARKNANPTLVAILPSGNRDDETSKTPYLPAGLWLYPLPFADDLRSANAQETDRCPDPLIEEMKKSVRNLQLPKAIYNPEKYPNPALQWHYKILQAKALEEDVPEQAEDQTVPKYRQIDKRVGEFLVDLKEEISVTANSFKSIRDIKQEGHDDGEHPAKRARTSKIAGPLGDAQVKKAVEDDTVKTMTVAELKDILARRGLATTGIKSKLVERLKEWAESDH